MKIGLGCEEQLHDGFDGGGFHLYVTSACTAIN
jgi:hypothetical protein